MATKSAAWFWVEAAWCWVEKEHEVCAIGAHLIEVAEDEQKDPQARGLLQRLVEWATGEMSKLVKITSVSERLGVLPIGSDQYDCWMDDPAETPDSFIQHVQETIQERTSLSSLGSSLSDAGDASWLTRILRKQRKFSFSRLFRILREIKVRDTEFFRGYIERDGAFDATIRNAQPQDLLRRARGEQGTMIGLLERVCTKSIQPIRRDAPLYGVPERAREIDSLREVDRESALCHAEIWVLEILATVKPGHTLAGAKVGELASALGVWASIERLLGRALTSALGLEMALRMHGIHRWSPAYADLLERSAVTLREMGAIEDGLDLASRACALFRLAGDPWSESKALMVFGALALNAGSLALATLAYERCIEIGADERRRSSALNGLAAIALQEGRLDDAEEALALAVAIEDLPPRIDLQIQWQGALVMAQRGQSLEAADRLERLLEQALDHLEPMDTFLLFFDLAKVLARLGEQRRFNRIALEMARYVPLLERHALASAVLAQFFTEVLNQPLQDLAVDETREAFEAAFRAAGQPPGSATPPIS